jgi:uncharacterized protein YecE (DUF72 family)
MSNQPGHVWIGTSNTVVPGNKSEFPAAFRLKSRLHYYSSLFSTVEVNKCFYKTPLFATYERWSQDVPQNFKFSLKLSKEITHAKDLQGDLACMDKFMKTAGGVGNKKGCLLVQFPGKITLDHFKQVEQIIQELQMHDPDQQWKKVLEFRNPSWYTGETWEMLDEYKASMVLHDIPKAKLFEFHGHASHVYIRFHGPKGDYRGSYADSFLNQKAVKIREWVNEGKDVYIYFNNTIGSAYENAIHLKSLLST